jgi:hypothetical protein
MKQRHEIKKKMALINKHQANDLLISKNLLILHI